MDFLEIPEFLPQRLSFEGRWPEGAAFTDDLTGGRRQVWTTDFARLEAMVGVRLRVLADRIELLRGSDEPASPRNLTRDHLEALRDISAEAGRIATAFQPLAPLALRVAGLAARCAGDQALAARYWSRLAEVDPNDADGQRQLARCVGELERADEVLSAAIGALKLQPGNSAALARLGWLMLLLGRHEQAAQWIARALAIDPDDRVSRNLARLAAEARAPAPLEQR